MANTTEAAVENPNSVDAIIRGIRANGHAQVLVVGVRGDNLPERYRNHPQVVTWSGDEAGRKDLPAAVRLVLQTRFVQHATVARLLKDCQSRGIPYLTRDWSTGRLRQLLAPLVEGPRAATAPVVEPEDGKDDDMGQLRSFKHGEQRAFVIEHGNIDAKPFSEEAERLFKLAKAKGIGSTAGSFAQAMYALRAERERRKEEAAALRRARSEGAAEVINGHHETVPPMPTPIVMAVPDAPDMAPTSDDTELIRMLDEVAQARDTANVALAKAKDALDLMSSAYDLVRETIIKRAAREEKLAKVAAMLKELQS